MSRCFTALLAWLAVLLLGACLDADTADELPQVCAIEERLVWPIHPPAALDVLFVVDVSPSMADQTPTLAANLREVALLAREGGIDMHVGVVASDLGAAAVPGCEAPRAPGAMQGGARCGLTGAFLTDRRLNDDSHVRNYPGELTDAFACLLDVPRSTCPVSQPLAAATLALDGSQPANDGFRREHARLLVAIITDSDDCSLVEPGVLAGVAGAADVEAAVDFQCFARGVRCDPADPAAPGPRTNCVARSDGGLVDVQATIAHLIQRTAYGDARLVHFAVVSGRAEVLVAPGPKLATVCASGAGVGPAPRLAGLAALDTSTPVDVCAETDWVQAFLLFGNARPLVGDAVCFDDELDRVPLVPGVQAECTAELVRELPSGERVSIAALPWCGAAGHADGTPCLRAGVDDLACPGPLVAVRAELGDRLLPFDTSLDVRCALPCE